MVRADGNCLHLLILLNREASLLDPESGNADSNELLPMGMKQFVRSGGMSKISVDSGLDQIGHLALVIICQDKR